MKPSLNYANFCLNRTGDDSNGRVPTKLPEQAAYLDLLCAVFKAPMIELAQTITSSDRGGRRPAA